MPVHKSSIARPGSFLAALLLATASGCQTLDVNLASVLRDTPESSTPPATPAESEATYYVEFRPHQKKPVLVSLALTEPTYVQQVLDQTKALKKFRRVKVELYRQLPQGGGHKIPVTYDRAKKRVDPATDYSIHPKDRLVVTEDTSTILDDMLEKLGGPASSLKSS